MKNIYKINFLEGYYLFQKICFGLIFLYTLLTICIIYLSFIRYNESSKDKYIYMNGASIHLYQKK